MKLFAKILVVLVLGAPAYALDPQQYVSQYAHTAWRMREGFFPGALTAITQTADGYLWIGTEFGLMRFDGLRFVPWHPPQQTPLPSERIFSLLGAKDGGLWIGTGSGLALWKSSKLTVYAKAGRFGTLLEDRSGVIWAGHTRDLGVLPPLCSVTEGLFRCFGAAEGLSSRYVSALHQDAQGNLWVGGEGGVCLWNAEKPHCYAIDGLQRYADRLGVSSIASDSPGYLWVDGGPTGIWRLKNGRWSHYLHPQITGELEANAMLQDRDGALWIGTRRKGIVRRAGSKEETFDQADGLSGDKVNCMLEDREGNIWVATTSGLDRFRALAIATFTTREGLTDSDVTAVAAAHDGGMWIAESSELMRFDGGKLVPYHLPVAKKEQSFTSLFEDSRQRLWAGLVDGLVRVEQNQALKIRMPDGRPMGVVRAMTEDRDGNLWVATTNPAHSLFHISNDQVLDVIPSSGFPADQVTAMESDPSGGIWIGLASNGLRRLRSGHSPEVFPDAARLSVHALLQDAVGLWIATKNGLKLLGPRGFLSLGVPQGLPCEDIEALIKSSDNALWVKASCGFFRLSSDDLAAWLAHRDNRIPVSLYDVRSGAQSGITSYTPRAARAADGRLWFASESAGVQVIDPAHLHEDLALPPVWIEKVVADATTYDPASFVRLPALTKNLEIDYTGLNLGSPEAVSFRYQLEGFGKGWQDAGNRRDAYFTNLKPGPYRFHVVATNNNSAWNEKGASVEFFIAPAFYQTMWFRVICLLAVIAKIVLVFQWRIRRATTHLEMQFRERLAERGRIAQDLHDTLLQGFISAAMQLHVANTHVPADSPAKPMVAQALDLTRRVIEEGRDALSGLRNPGGPSRTLEQSFYDLRDEVVCHSDVEFRVIIEGSSRLLNPIVQEDIQRIAREALTNAFRHANASKVEVELQFDPRHLRVLIRDNGRGIDQRSVESGVDRHWGLSGMQERTARIGGSVRIVSAKDAGTEIELLVPAQVAFSSETAPKPRPSWWRRGGLRASDSKTPGNSTE